MAKKGGAWKVAYADFATAMMAFFLVMWITTQSKPVKQAVAQYFENPEGNNLGVRSTSEEGEHSTLTIGDFQKGRGPGSGMVMSQLNSSAEHNSQGTAARKPPRLVISQLETRFTSKGTGISIADDSTELDQAARDRLSFLIPLLLPRNNAIEIQAFAQRRALTSESKVKDMQELCYARCEAVMNYLVGRGIPKERIRFCLDNSPELMTTSTFFRGRNSEREQREKQTKGYNVFVFSTEPLPKEPETPAAPPPEPSSKHSPGGHGSKPAADDHPAKPAAKGH